MKKYILSFLFVILYSVTANASPITKEEVLKVQQKWADGIVNIGKVYTNGGDYVQAAKDHINKLYAYGDSDVLFKPTKASDNQFRYTKDMALSYFVGGRKVEDKGFAINPWSKVRFDKNQQMIINDDFAITMGNYYFTDANTGNETKVEYTFGYARSPKDGHLEIFLHHSSLPYSPAYE